MTHLVVMTALCILASVILWRDIKYLCEHMGH